MKEFVQISLETYDSLKSNVEYLKGALKYAKTGERK